MEREVTKRSFKWQKKHNKTLAYKQSGRCAYDTSYHRNGFYLCSPELLLQFAKQYLVSKLNAVTSILSLYADDTSVNFSSEVRNMLENFSEKDKMELMAINSKGHIALTSSGFSPDSDTVMNDYEDAIKSDNNYGYYIGKQDGDEK